MTALRVLQFITPNGFYGAERWVWALVNNLDPQAVVCDLAVTREGPDQDLTVADQYPGNGQVHYLDMNSRLDIGVVRQLADLINRNGIDIIHTHGYKSDIIGLMAARKAGIRCVSTPHGYPARAGFKMSLFIRAGVVALKRFDAIAPLSPDLMKDMKRFQIRPDKVHFIENGVDLTELEPHRKLSDASSGKLAAPHLGYVGQLIARKNIANMIRMFQRVWQQYPEAQLTLVGDGSDRPALEALAQSLPCADRIRFMGFCSDRLDLVKTFDAFVMTSSLEGIPRCLMEAMAIGTPVIAYDIPGVNDLVQDGETGLLAPLGDIEQLARQVLRIAEEPVLRHQLIQQARTRVDEHFSARRMAAEYEALFSELVAEKRGAA